MFDEIVQHHLLLLRQFDSFSKKLGFRYVLANHSAWDAEKFGRYHDGMFETAVMVLQGDFERMVSSGALPSHLRFDIDSREGCDARLIDDNSTLIDYRRPDRYKTPAAGIDIVVAKEAPSGKLQVTKPDGAQFEICSTMYDELATGKLNGYSFPVFADVDSYLSALVSKGWRNITYPFFISKMSIEIVFDSATPYRVFLNRPVVRDSLTFSNKLKRRRYWRWKKKVYDPALKKRKRYALYLQRTGDRFNLWEQFYPQKLELKLLNKSGDKAALESRLLPFIERIEFWYKEGLGFSFDEELFEMALPFIEKRHGGEYVETLLKMIPPIYREKSIENILRENGVKHPLLS